VPNWAMLDKINPVRIMIVRAIERAFLFTADA
jgi:hypothetical protein